MTDRSAFRIHPALPDDAGVVADLVRSALREAWSEDTLPQTLAAPGAVAFVARGADGAVAGFIAGQRVLDELHVLWLAVAPAWRRRGVAGALLAAALGDPPARSVLLEVRASNEDARHFYRALGFDEVGRRRGYYPDGEDALLLTRGPAPPGATHAGAAGGAA